MSIIQKLQISQLTNNFYKFWADNFPLAHTHPLLINGDLAIQFIIFLTFLKYRT